MATNSLINPEVITRESTLLLKNNLVMGNTVSRANQSDFRKIGSDLYVRKPNSFSVQSGAATTPENVEEAWQKVSIQTQDNVSWEFSTRDLTLTVEEYSKRYIAPAMRALTHNIEYKLHSLYKKVYHSTGTPGTPPATFLELAAGGTLLSDHAAPMGQRCSMLSTDATVQLANQVGGFKSGYGANGKSLTAQEKVSIGYFGGFDNYESQSVNSHTAGIWDGSPVLDGATTGTTYAASKNNTTDSLSWTQTLHFDGATTDGAGYAKEGDVFTIADCYSVNPANGKSTGKLQNFVVRADVTTASNEADIVVSPPIIVAGPYKTCEFASGVSDLDGKALTPIADSTDGAAKQNLVYHKDAITFGMVPLEKPDSTNWADTFSDDGYSMRAYKWLDGTNDKEMIRLDVMYFMDVVHPDLIARIHG